MIALFGEVVNLDEELILACGAKIQKYSHPCPSACNSYQIDYQTDKINMKKKPATKMFRTLFVLQSL